MGQSRKEKGKEVSKEGSIAEVLAEEGPSWRKTPQTSPRDMRRKKGVAA